MFIKGKKTFLLPKLAAIKLAEKNGIKDYNPEENEEKVAGNILYRLTYEIGVFLIRENLASIVKDNNDYVILFKDAINYDITEIKVDEKTYTKVLEWLNNDNDKFLEFTLRNAIRDKIKINKSKIAAYQGMQMQYNDSIEKYTTIYVGNSWFDVIENFEEVDKIFTGVKDYEETENKQKEQ